MIFTSLQIWGALFFLLNKILFAKSERCVAGPQKEKYLLYAWSVYLIALPAWVAVFISQSNWIAAAVEAGSAPAIIAGLLRVKGQSTSLLDNLATVFIALGITLSIYDFGGITQVNQVLELGITLGFLMGTHNLAKQNRTGYLWLFWGNINCAVLMARQGFYIFMIQQLISLIFVFDALYSSGKTKQGLRARH